MKNSFKKTYETQTMSDGSVEISFKASRFSGSGAMGVMILLLPVCLIGGGYLVQSFEKGTKGDAVMAVIVCCAFFYGLMKLFGGKKKIVVKPNIGLMFSGKSLPFDDIKSFGVMEQISQQGLKTAYLQAITGGTSVNVTGYTSSERAEAIGDEIMALSGRNWK